MNSEIICIIDRSGSMAAITKDAIGGFNTFLEEQKKIPGDATLTFVQFDTEYEVVHENRSINDVPALNEDTFRPRGATALLDAIGKTIDNTGKRLDSVPKENRPDKIIVAILTDGQENSSHQYNRSKVKEMIQHQKERYQWEFIFLAANQDAFAEAVSLGINTKDAFNFQATPKGTQAAYRNMNMAVSQYRGEDGK